MSELADPETEAPPRTPTPHPRLRDLDVLVGTWRMEGRDSGGQPFTGTVIREWLPGGYFLTQTTQLDGHSREGAEYIGYDASSGEVRSMLFGAEGPGPFCSFALEYIWQIDGDALTIWHGFRDSPAKFTGTIDRHAAVISGAWEWPGGGYEVTATRTTS